MRGPVPLYSPHFPPELGQTQHSCHQPPTRRRAPSVHSSRILPSCQIPSDGPRTDLEGLPNLHHGASPRSE